MGTKDNLQKHRNELIGRLDHGWQYVGPGGSHDDDERFLQRWLELLAEYEKAEDLMHAVAVA